MNPFAVAISRGLASMSELVAACAELATPRPSSTWPTAACTRRSAKAKA